MPRLCLALGAASSLRLLQLTCLLCSLLSMSSRLSLLTRLCCHLLFSTEAAFAQCRRHVREGTASLENEASPPWAVTVARFLSSLCGVTPSESQAVTLLELPGGGLVAGSEAFELRRSVPF